MVKAGEILSLVGLVGSGKEELCRCITGLDKPDTGSVSIKGKRFTPGFPSEAVRLGIGHVPIDRRNDGLALGMSIAQNVNLLVLEELKTGGFVNPLRERQNALRWINECRIKCPSPATVCGNLSGGNQQKAVIAMADIPSSVAGTRPSNAGRRRGSESRDLSTDSQTRG